MSVDVIEIGFRKYKVTLDKNDNSELIRISQGLNQSPSNTLHWLIWHFVKSGGIVTVGGKKGQGGD